MTLKNCLKIKNYKIKNFIEYLFYIFVFLLPIQTRYIYHYGELNGGVWEYGTASIYLTDILLLIIFLPHLFTIIKRVPAMFNFQFSIFKQFFNVRIFKSVTCCTLCVTCYILLSLLWASNKFLTLYYFSILASGLILFYFIQKINFSFRKFSITFILAAAVQAIFAIQQFFTQQVIASRWLGMAAQSPLILGVSVIENSWQRWLRAYGTLTHPNVLGGFLAVSLLILTWFYMVNQKEVLSVFNIKKEKIKNIILIFSALFLVAGLFVSFSRSAWIAFAAGLIVYYFFIVRHKSKFIHTRFLMLLIYMISCVIALSFVLQEPLTARVSFFEGRLEKKSLTERAQQYDEAKMVAKGHLWQGIGLGNYTFVLSQVAPNLESFLYQPVHNVFVLVVVELGITGLLIWLALLVLIIGKIKLSSISGSLFDSREKSFNELLIPLIVSFIVLMILDHYLWTLHFGILLFWMILGVLYKTSNESQ